MNSLPIFCILLGPCAAFCSLFVMDGKGCSLSAQPSNAECPSVPMWTYLNCIILKYTFILATCHQQTTRVLLDRTPCFAQCFLCSVEHAISCGQITTHVFWGCFSYEKYFLVCSLTHNGKNLFKPVQSKRVGTYKSFFYHIKWDEL